MGVFYERFCELCIEHNTVPTEAAKSIGLSNAAQTGWKNGGKPRETTYRKLAQKFGVSVAYLKGESDEKNPQSKNDRGSKNEIPTNQEIGRDDDVTKELLDIIYNGSSEDRLDLLEMYKIFKRRKSN